MRVWGPDQTSRYLQALRDTLKGLVHDTVAARLRDDLRPGLQMVVSGRHCIFFGGDDTRVLVVRILHDRMDYRRHLSRPAGRGRGD